jgi:hypothetical protein
MITSRWRRLLIQVMTPKDWIATFIAILALTTAVWSGVATRTYNRLASRPHLQVLSLLATSSPRLGSEVGNQGPGIAIIDDFDLFLDGNRLPGDGVEKWEPFRKATGTEDWTNRGVLQKGEIFTTGIAQILLIVDESKFSREKSVEWKERSDRLRQVLRRLTVIIRYHSVYGEFFEIERRGFEPPRYRRRNWLGQFVEWQP